MKRIIISGFFILFVVNLYAQKIEAVKKNYKMISKKEFDKIKAENKLKPLLKYSDITANVYEYGSDVLIENFKAKKYWIEFDKEKYFADVDKIEWYNSDSFERRFDRYLVDLPTLESHKKELLDILWKELGMDKTKLLRNNYF